MRRRHLGCPRRRPSARDSGGSRPATGVTKCSPVQVVDVLRSSGPVGARRSPYHRSSNERCCTALAEADAAGVGGQDGTPKLWRPSNRIATFSWTPATRVASSLEHLQRQRLEDLASTSPRFRRVLSRWRRGTGRDGAGDRGRGRGTSVRARRLLDPRDVETAPARGSSRWASSTSPGWFASPLHADSGADDLASDLQGGGGRRRGRRRPSAGSGRKPASDRLAAETAGELSASPLPEPSRASWL
jgi:hypothetical protein